MTVASWERKRLRYLADLNPSKSEIAEMDRATEVSFIPMEAVGENGELDLSQHRPIGEVETGYTFLRDGDVAYAKITPCFENGKAAEMVGLTEGVAFATTELTVLRPRPGLANGRFLFWLIKSPEFSVAGEATMTGAGGQKRVPDAFARNFEIACPPLAEQKAIAAFLDRETAKLDALVEEQRRLIALLKEKRQAVITHAVTRGIDPAAPLKPSGIDWLGDIPAHWDAVPVGYRYEIQLGRMLNAERAEGDYPRPYLRVFDVQWHQINTEDLPLMDFPPDAQERYRLEAGDLMVNEGGSYVGRSAIWRGEVAECYYQKALHRLRPRNREQDFADFFVYVMEYATTKGIFVAGGNQTTIDHLTAEQLRRYRFAFPPSSEQLQIGRYLGERLSQMDNLTTQATRAIALLQERRAALISAAVTGKIDVRDTVVTTAPEEAA